MSLQDEHSLMAAQGMIHEVRQQFEQVAACMTDPSVLYRPTLTIDGDKWCALYGANLQEGVAGFGDSPYEAMMNFDKAWHAKLQIKQEAAGHDQ